MTEENPSGESTTIVEISNLQEECTKRLQEKCTRLYVQIAVLRLKFHSNQQKDGLFIVRIVFLITGNPERIAGIKCDHIKRFKSIYFL
ncbi:predicted protein [Methanosarcina acetivorans C2A]|jgi:hypothetical protein|uniref:Uncharacterized protein n=1 Tax=Methanosarcina acetivorans (strain ATCC 35395 / DSM 2834 / JCM 12185 / C2A) TaxID=188937 RepID=Q8TTK7_METAC|nr:predicted protein [Methanosarcina acetivorans C2A]